MRFSCGNGVLLPKVVGVPHVMAYSLPNGTWEVGPSRKLAVMVVKVECFLKSLVVNSLL